MLDALSGSLLGAALGRRSAELWEWMLIKAEENVNALKRKLVIQ